MLCSRLQSLTQALENFNQVGHTSGLNAVTMEKTFVELS